MSYNALVTEDDSLVALLSDIEKSIEIVTLDYLYDLIIAESKDKITVYLDSRNSTVTEAALNSITLLEISKFKSIEFSIIHVIDEHSLKIKEDIQSYGKLSLSFLNISDNSELVSLTKKSALENKSNKELLLGLKTISKSLTDSKQDASTDSTADPSKQQQKKKDKEASLDDIYINQTLGRVVTFIGDNENSLPVLLNFGQTIDGSVLIIDMCSSASAFFDYTTGVAFNSLSLATFNTGLYSFDNDISILSTKSVNVTKSSSMQVKLDSLALSSLREFKSLFDNVLILMTVEKFNEVQNVDKLGLPVALLQASLHGLSQLDKLVNFSFADKRVAHIVKFNMRTLFMTDDAKNELPYLSVLQIAKVIMSARNVDINVIGVVSVKFIRYSTNKAEFLDQYAKLRNSII